MSKKALVFVHGVDEKPQKKLEMRRWRRALAKGGLDLTERGYPSFSAHYADWFFEPLNETSGFESMDQAATELDERSRTLSRHVALNYPKNALDAEAKAILASRGRSFETYATESQTLERIPEFLGGRDITSFVPTAVLEGFLHAFFGQVQKYFNNSKIEHSTNGETGLARDIIRERFVDAVREARQAVGPEGKVVVIAHSMGSMVAWDCLSHVSDCPSVDGLVTIGSPLALDGIQDGLRLANGVDYQQTFPTKLRGEWRNIIARFDFVGRLDSDLAKEFPGQPHQKITDQVINNPDFSLSFSPSSTIESAHSLVGYLRSPACISALQDMGLSPRTEPSRWEAFVSSLSDAPSQAAAMEMACERYEESAEQRQNIEAQLKTPGGLNRLEAPERIINRIMLSGQTEEFARNLVLAAKEDSGVLERVLDEVDFQHSSYLLKGAALTRAVGQIVVRTSSGKDIPYGTGFLVSPNLIMTNNHVIASKAAATRAFIRFDYGRDSEDREQSPVRVGLRPDLFFVTSPSKQLDYTVVAIDPAYGAMGRPWIHLIAGSGKALVGQHVNILQHPSGRRQEVAFRDSKVTYIGEQKPYAHYRADTEGGSSGSPVLNDYWQLAYLHHSAIPRRNAQRQVLNKDGSIYREGQPDSGIDWIANEGIRISQIVKHLRRAELSSPQRDMLDRCFEDPDLTTFVGMGGGHTERQAQAGLPNEGAFQPQQAGGRASWMFELSFGPAGISAAPVSASQAVHAGQPSPNAPSPVASPFSAPPSYDDDGVSPSTVSLDQQIRNETRRLLENAPLEYQYYDEETDQTSIDLYYENIAFDAESTRTNYSSLHDLLRRTQRKQYAYRTAKRRFLYPYVDIHEDRYLRSIYSGLKIDPEQLLIEEIEDSIRQLPDFESLTGRFSLDLLEAMESQIFGGIEMIPSDQRRFNCEHVVPQSRYDKRQPMVSDMHHLFTCEKRCNSYRNKYPYGDVPGYQPDPVSSFEADVRHQCGKREDLDGQEVFEPENGKGPVARATLYFLLRYPGEFLDEAGEFPDARLADLVRWHEEDPVTVYEKHRNRSIFLAQGNRNPLIDHPEWVSELDFARGLTSV
ncbi:MAG: endonuclease [Pseudomonadota bacterium]